jgi:hypothetical protein
MSEWTKWSSVDASGTVFRYRYVLRPALDSGKACEDLLQLKKGIVYIAWLCNLVLTYFITIGITVTETSLYSSHLCLTLSKKAKYSKRITYL